MGRKFRARSLNEVFKEIRFLIDKYDIKKLMIIDDNFTHNKRRAKEFCDEFKAQDFGIEIHFMVLALWCMDEELIDKLQSIGCTSMGFAIESGVQNIVTNVIKKPLNLTRSMELLRYAKKKGIHLTGTFVIGFPGETKKDIQRSLYMANYSGLFDSREIYIATPLPGSELFKTCEEGGWFAKDFSYDNVEVVKPNIETEDFSAAYIETIVEADRTHHLVKTYPGRIIQLIKDVRRRKPHIYLQVLFETAKMFLKYDFLRIKEEYP
ncbi:MAG: radical SAM protein [Thermodesulfobacteriota bacterium]